jgi:hypothetical protein
VERDLSGLSGRFVRARRETWYDMSLCRVPGPRYAD